MGLFDKPPSIVLGTFGLFNLSKVALDDISTIAHHRHVLGKTGTGKSRLVAKTIIRAVDAIQNPYSEDAWDAPADSLKGEDVIFPATA